MTARFGRIATATLVGAATLLFSSPAFAAGVSIRTLAAEEMHLATIAYRIGTGNADLCARQQMMTGMVLHDLSQYDRSARAAVSSAFSIVTGVGVLELVPGSAAEQAGLQIDDEILAVDRRSVEQSVPADADRGSYRRMERFQTVLESALERGPAELLVRRHGELRTLVLAGQRGCGGRLSLTDSSALNAWSDGTHVVVTTGMSQLAGADDQIAFVIAHEMAHNILDHSRDSEKRMGIFGFGRGLAKARRSEIDADRFAVRLMNDAGYRPSGGIAFLQKASRRLWWSMSLDHPGFGTRIRAVAAAMADAGVRA